MSADDTVRFLKLTTPDTLGDYRRAAATRFVTEADPQARGQLLHDLLDLFRHAALQLHNEAGTNPAKFFISLQEIFCGPE